MTEEGARVDRVYVEESILGIFGVSVDNEILEKTLYPADPKQIAAAMGKQMEGSPTREVEETIEKLMQRGFKRLVFSNRALAEAVKARWGVEVEVETGAAAGSYIRDHLEELAIDLGWVRDAQQLYTLIHEVAVSMARGAVGKALSEREAVIGQTVHALGELDKMLNTLSGRLREWYGLHLPELGRLVEDHRAYARIVETLGDRENFEPKKVVELGLRRKKAEEICRAAQGSMGASIGREDLNQIRHLASHLLALYRYRRALEEYLSALAEEVAPNLSAVAGPVLAAKLLDKAGGLRRLAMMPSSTLQLLGAEKAMFRALKSGSKPPKHGLIFQHPFVHASPRRMRGRRARALAAKLSIAARADAFSGKSIGAKLRGELDSLRKRGKGKNIPT